MTLRPRATELPELVGRLGSRAPRRVDEARARLAMMGSRAVDALVDALDGEQFRVRANAMPLLALSQETRAREALAGMLVDRDPRLREIAARSLGRFASPDAVAALERALERDRALEVRLAALQALVELYETGQEGAVRRPLDLLLDPQAGGRLREAAFALLPLLRAGERRSILRRLRQDPNPDVARRATRSEDTLLLPGRVSPRPIPSLLKKLANDEYQTWFESVRGLAACGPSAVVPIVEAMRRRAHDPEYCARAGIALRAMGPRRARALALALDHVDEPLPLQVLIEVTGALGDKSLVYRLKDLIERVRTAPPHANGFDPMQRVRAKAHLELARVGSRCAIRDLRDLLAAGDIRLESEALEALERIGTREEIPDLLRAFAREDRFTRERIRRAVAAIMRRERIRRNAAMFRNLSPAQRRALEAVLPPPARRRRAVPRHR